MTEGQSLSASERIKAVLSHLQVSRAHFASALAGEIEPLLKAEPERAASLTLVNPNRLNVALLTELEDRLTLVTGDAGMPAGVVADATERLPKARVLAFSGYATAAWSDAVADHPEAIGDVMRDRIDGTDVAPPVRPAGSAPGSVLRGEVAGVSFEVQGSGPALVLLPLALAPSQWDPIVASLAKDFSVIRLGGAHLGMVAMLESRGAEPGYQRAVRSVFDEAAPVAGETIMEVGCGTGVLARWIAHHTASACPIIACDLNPYFLREARALADKEGLGRVIRFDPANAEALPFDDDLVDIAFSSTVMEECDADKMLEEMIRVTRPGGRVAVMVRAIDAHSICSVAVQDDIKSIIEAPYPSVGEKGCADASLYRRFSESTLMNCQFFPHLLTLRDPTGAAWAYREPFFLAQFNEEQKQRWQTAKENAVASNQFVFASGLHCAVGTKPH